MLKRIIVLCVSLVVWSFVTPVEGAEFQCAAGDVACLIQAIHASNGNGEANTIRLEAGTYSLTTFDHGSALDGVGLPAIVGSVAVVGAGTDATILQRNPDLVPGQQPRFGIFEVASTGRLELEHLTLANGSRPSSRGGAVSSRGALRIRNAVIRNNFAGEAGAIWAPGGDLDLTDSYVRNNSSQSLGAAVLIGCFTCPATTATTTVTRSTFAANGGPGIFTIDSGAPVAIRDSTFIDNRSDSNGVVMVTAPAVVTVTNSTFIGNGGIGAGPGIAVRAVQGDVLVTNSTIINNQGGVAGVRVQNSIVSGNNVPAGPAPGVGDCVTGVIGVTSSGNNLFGNAANCGALPTDLTGDAGLGSFVDSGRPGGGYVPLLADSRAIDAADSASCPGSDQRGLTRGIDGNGDGIRGCDIGAVEFYPVVNDRVQLEGLQYSFVKPSNLGFADSRASAGAFRITALFRNNGPDICNVAFDVPTLDGPAGTNPVLLTPARELLGGQGTAVSAAKAGAQPHLPSDGSQAYQFTIGVQQRTSINFLVDALGDATSGPCGQ